MHDTMRMTIKIPVYVILYNSHMFLKKNFPLTKTFETGKTVLSHFADVKLGSEDSDLSKVIELRFYDSEFYIFLTYCSTINISMFLKSKKN